MQYTDVQSQKEENAYFSSKRLLPLALQIRMGCSVMAISLPFVVSQLRCSGVSLLHIFQPPFLSQPIQMEMLNSGNEMKERDCETAKWSYVTPTRLRQNID